MTAGSSEGDPVAYGKPHNRHQTFGGILALGINMRDPENWDKPNFSARDVIKIYEDFGLKLLAEELIQKEGERLQEVCDLLMA